MASTTPKIIMLDRAYFSDIASVVRKEGGRLPTLSEFIVALRDPDQHRLLKGDSYRLGDEPGLRTSRYCRLGENGEIHQLGPIAPMGIPPTTEPHPREWLKLPKEQRVITWNGKHQLILAVGDESHIWALGIFAGYPEDFPARVAFIRSNP